MLFGKSDLLIIFLECSFPKRSLAFLFLFLLLRLSVFILCSANLIYSIIDSKSLLLMMYIVSVIFLSIVSLNLGMGLKTYLLFRGVPL